MRRSKADPAKYTKNYRSISQRRMTHQPDDVIEKEEAKLQTQIDRADKIIQAAIEQQRTKDDDVENDADRLDDSFYDNEYGDGSNAMILQRKKKRKKEQQVQISAEELRQAQKDRKNNQRKLRQLHERKAKKQKRTQLYDTLAQHAVQSQELELFHSSATLGKHDSKKEKLKRIMKKQRAGIELTKTEEDALYVKIEVDEADVTDESKRKEVENNLVANSRLQNKLVAEKTVDSIVSSNDVEILKVPVEENICKPINNVGSNEKEPPDEDATKPASSWSKSIMSSLASLKTKQNDKEKIIAEDNSNDNKSSCNDDHPGRSKYVPVPIDVRTPAESGLVSELGKVNEKNELIKVQRSPELQHLRYSLPVCEMEFEIIEAIKENDVTIIAGETGSGKSTQIPQFCYEAGFTFGSRFTIGVTQPRRVAAVSTAKRVAYELNCIKENDQYISSKSSFVGYSTRYESAGLGPSNCVKFMTDGILLSEIQDDLLLRNYSVIIIDEAHERNLNTDVLLGLLSKTLMLRKDSTKEDSLPMLKVIIMSATLKVSDFTNSLYPEAKVLKIPGRTFPVTVHFSKHTELDDYETVALEKTCKIHRKLPPGAILIFLTGKSEIIRMVQQLRKRLCKSYQKEESSTFAESSQIRKSHIRDMDDDEEDGDIFNQNEDDLVSLDQLDQNNKLDTKQKRIENSEEGIINVIVLPLYSMLTPQEQAKVFSTAASIDSSKTRLIVVSTNIAETSITIPTITYVVDCGRHKVKNYHPVSGITSYDVMWISKASADQRAGRAGRTNAGHCYRLYSSAVYERSFDAFALPEVITRPLEDVVLRMKSMHIRNVLNFPFPTPPDPQQIKAALKLLSDLGCIIFDSNKMTTSTGRSISTDESTITQLGQSCASLPLSVRYSKMLLVGAASSVLDYMIGIVAAMSEDNPFQDGSPETKSNDDDSNSITSDENLDKVDKSNLDEAKRVEKEDKRKKWLHPGGDALSRLAAVGAYSFAGRGAGGVSEQMACRKFCTENGLNFAVMQRVHKLRLQLARMCKSRLNHAKGVAAELGTILYDMPPPSNRQIQLLQQGLASGLVDHVARRSGNSRFEYISCKGHSITEVLFVDRKSACFKSGGHKKDGMPEWVCYDSIVRKPLRRKDDDPEDEPSTIAVMTNVTPLESTWLSSIAEGSALLTFGDLITDSPVPIYSRDEDAILCSIETRFGDSLWPVPSHQVNMYDSIINGSNGDQDLLHDVYCWFARYFLEGKVFPKLHNLISMLNDPPAIITRRKNVAKVHLLVSTLQENKIHNAKALIEAWEKKGTNFLYNIIKSWIKKSHAERVKSLWISLVNDALQSLKE